MSMAEQVTAGRASALVRTKVLGVSAEHETVSGHLQPSIPVGNLRVLKKTSVLCFVFCFFV